MLQIPSYIRRKCLKSLFLKYKTDKIAFDCYIFLFLRRFFRILGEYVQLPILTNETMTIEGVCMKIKLGKRSFTFLVIPDANSKVMRFRLSALLLYSLTISISVIGIVLITLTFSMNVSGMKNLNEKKIIAAELANKTSDFKKTLSNKDATIENLQNSLVELAVQTEVMKQKVDELKAFEEDIRSISSADSKSTNGEVGIASYSLEGITTEGIGGSSLEASDEDITSLVSGTQQTLLSLTGDISSLKLQFTDTKESILQYNQLMRITPSLWPTSSRKISSLYGFRKDPFSRRAAFHAGLDISGDSGDPIYATADGVVTSSGYDRAYGYNIMIKHASGVSTHYAHMRKLLVEKGQTVKQGETIGQLGSTGRSTGPHLHFEVIKNGATIDPKPYLQAAGKGVKFNVQEEKIED
jgi:murein DD-endopeptidase MepM/ murein hydrolase activator NlpD